MFEDAFIDSVISRNTFATMPIIIPEHLRNEDIEAPLNGIISSQSANGSIAFSIKNIDATSVTYSFGDEQQEVTRIEYQENGIQFTVPLRIGVENLLIYFDGEPALGYKIQ